MSIAVGTKVQDKNGITGVVTDAGSYMADGSVRWHVKFDTSQRPVGYMGNLGVSYWTEASLLNVWTPIG